MEVVYGETIIIQSASFTLGALVLEGLAFHFVSSWAETQTTPLRIILSPFVTHPVVAFSAIGAEKSAMLMVLGVVPCVRSHLVACYTFLDFVFEFHRPLYTKKGHPLFGGCPLTIQDRPDRRVNLLTLS